MENDRDILIEDLEIYGDWLQVFMDTDPNFLDLGKTNEIRSGLKRARRMLTTDAKA